MADFASILNRPAESIEKPKPRPPGTYLCLVDGQYKQREINDKPVIDITLKTMQAQEDVDTAALQEAGGVGNKVQLTFFLVTNDGNDNSYQLKNFLENHLGIESTGKSLSQMLAEAPGKQVYCTLKHEIYTDKNTQEPAIAVRAGSTAKV